MLEIKHQLALVAVWATVVGEQKQLFSGAHWLQFWQYSDSLALS